MKKSYQLSPNAIKDNFFILLLSVACLFSIGIGEYFLFSRNKHLTTIPVISPIPDASKNPVVTSPKMDEIVTSPLTIKGTVPAGWMFEGVFPIEIYDLDNNLITTSIARETTAGNWQSGNPVEFISEVIFTTNLKSGYILLKNDNPSGLAENDKMFKLPVKFLNEDDNESVACTMEAKLCPDGKTYVGRSGPRCEFALCP